MKGPSVHPAIATIIIMVLLGVVFYLFTFVFTGQHAGSVGSPGPANSRQ